MVTFGGAYAVLPYVAQQAVQHYGWLGAGQMLDGLGLAETTPGPFAFALSADSPRPGSKKFEQASLLTLRVR